MSTLEQSMELHAPGFPDDYTDLKTLASATRKVLTCLEMHKQASRESIDHYVFEALLQAFVLGIEAASTEEVALTEDQALRAEVIRDDLEKDYLFNKLQDALSGLLGIEHCLLVTATCSGYYRFEMSCTHCGSLRYSYPDASGVAWVRTTLWKNFLVDHGSCR